MVPTKLIQFLLNFSYYLGKYILNPNNTWYLLRLGSYQELLELGTYEK